MMTTGERSCIVDPVQDRLICKNLRESGDIDDRSGVHSLPAPDRMR